MDVDIGYSSGLEDIGQCGQLSVQTNVNDQDKLFQHISWGLLLKIS